jgi:hypothetical protein
MNPEDNKKSETVIRKSQITEDEEEHRFCQICDSETSEISEFRISLDPRDRDNR